MRAMRRRVSIGTEPCIRGQPALAEEQTICSMKIPVPVPVPLCKSSKRIREPDKQAFGGTEDEKEKKGIYGFLRSFESVEIAADADCLTVVLFVYRLAGLKHGMQADVD